MSNESVLEEGQIILEGRYRIVQLLYKRPRLNLYLGRRLSNQATEKGTGDGEQGSLVAIRELVLTALPSPIRAQVEAAAFEEFVSPVVLGSPRLPTRGDRVWFEGERYYLVMQLSDQKNDLYTSALTLDELLLGRREWPVWLSTETAQNWGVQLCRIVARLHRLGTVLGYLDPATVLVSGTGAASWAPVLLTSWPPPPQCWQSASMSCSELCRQIFPIAILSRHNAFAAPEMQGGTYDERSDIYSLGAILYLLLTRYAPIASIHRLQTAQQAIPHAHMGKSVRPFIPQHVIAMDTNESLELIPPHILYHRISPALEQIVLRALELNPARRYPSVFAMVEALEAVELAGMSAYERKLPGGIRARKMMMRISGRSG